MPGGRPRTPTNLKLIAGTARKDRSPKNEPKPTRTVRPPAPPKSLSRIGINEWKRIAKELHRLGLLSTLDKTALTIYCKAVQEEAELCGRIAAYNLQNPDTPNLVKTASTGALKPHPWIQQRDVARRQIKDYLVEFGMSPASRSRVDARDEGGDDPYKKFK